MDLHTLKPPKGSKKNRKRVGRGTGSGSGKTSGRGHKGQGSRSGYTRRYGHEGGQWPLQRHLPKVGFTNIFRTEYQIVNLADLNKKFEAGDINPDSLKQAGLIKKKDVPVKVLGNGNVDKAFQIKANVFSKAAIAKIEAAGGKAEVI